MRDSKYYLEYNGTSTNDIGDVIVTRSSVDSRPMRKHEVVKVPGRNGDIVIYQDAYEDVQMSYEIVAGSGADNTVGLKYDEIAAWLFPEDTEVSISNYIYLTLNGYRQLIDGSDPLVTRLARVTNGFDVEHMLTRAGRANISFSCRPERFAAQAFTEQQLGSYKTVSDVAYVELSDAAAGQEVQDMVINIPFTGEKITGLTIAKTGHNMLRYPYYNATRVDGGKTITAESDGSISITGTSAATGSVNFYIESKDGATFCLPLGQFTLSGIPAPIDKKLYFYDLNRSAWRYVYGGQQKTITQSFALNENLYLAVIKGYDDTTVIYPQITFYTDKDLAWESPAENTFIDVDWTEETPNGIYGGTYNPITGVLINKYDADGNYPGYLVEYDLDPITIDITSSDCYLWSSLGTVSITYSATQTMNNPTDRIAKPIIAVYGSGDGTLIVGDSTIEVEDLDTVMYIDSETENCYGASLENLNSQVTVTGGFPVLSPGSNTYSFTGFDSISIWPRWWTL